MHETVIAGGARTAFGKLGGIFRSASAAELGAIAIQGAIQRTATNGAEVDQVLIGMAVQAGAGQNPARQAARLAGLDWSVPAETINKVCASGLRAITLAHQIIRCGGAQRIVAGGMESMSNIPYASYSTRWGSRMGHTKLTDLLIQDGLTCAYDHVLMAQHGNRVAAEYGISRQEQDEWALRSHVLAVSAAGAGRLAEEIVQGESGGEGKQGASATNSANTGQSDEGPRPDTHASKLAGLPSITGSDGTITAGNAPGVNDGAAAVVVLSKELAEREGRQGYAVILGHAEIGVEAPNFVTAPALAVQKLLHQTGYSAAAIDLWEVNEAFAAVVLACGRHVPWPAERVNVNGGAIALGHPIGASGARIVLTLIHELRRRGGGLGIAAICSGGGQGDALLVRVEG